MKNILSIKCISKWIYIIGLFAVLLIQSCTFTKRYHSRGFLAASAIRYQPGGANLFLKEAGYKTLLKSQSKSPQTFIKHKKSLKIDDNELRELELSFFAHSTTNNKFNGSYGGSLLKNDFPSNLYSVPTDNYLKKNEKVKPVKVKLISDVREFKSVNYVDTADPEFWANIFLILGLVVGAAALVFPIKVLGAIALLLLLIGVGCAALCEGDFYYSSTKILAIISAIILFLWGGVNADIFDL